MAHFYYPDITPYTFKAGPSIAYRIRKTRKNPIKLVGDAKTTALRMLENSDYTCPYVFEYNVLNDKFVKCAFINGHNYAIYFDKNNKKCIKIPIGEECTILCGNIMMIYDWTHNTCKIYMDGKGMETLYEASKLYIMKCKSRAIGVFTCGRTLYSQDLITGKRENISECDHFLIRENLIYCWHPNREQYIINPFTKMYYIIEGELNDNIRSSYSKLSDTLHVPRETMRDIPNISTIYDDFSLYNIINVTGTDIIYEKKNNAYSVNIKTRKKELLFENTIIDAENLYRQNGILLQGDPSILYVFTEGTSFAIHHRIEFYYTEILENYIIITQTRHRKPSGPIYIYDRKGKFRGRFNVWGDDDSEYFKSNFDTLDDYIIRDGQIVDLQMY